VYLLNQVPAPTAIYSCADGGGSGLESCTAPVPNGGSLSTSSVGANKLTVTATDRAGNTASKTNTYTVVYRVGGWNSDVVWRAAPGYGVPLTVQLTDIVGSNRSASAVTVTESRLVQLNTTAKGSTTSQVASTAPAELDRRFNWDAANQRYTHTDQTDGLATGTWRLYFTTSDSPGFEYYVDFKVKAS
jgi:hypothetical protein